MTGRATRRKGPGRIAIAGALLAAFLLGAETAAAGSIGDFSFPSAALGKVQKARVYVPDGEAPPGGWPVLYLLHGLGGEATDWQEAGGIKETLDRMIADKTIRPLLVVMPGVGDSWYVDSKAIGGPGDYASLVAHDLPDAVEAAFPVSRKAAARAIAGLSMGGYGALRLALSEPQRYAAVAALSPAIWQNVPAEDFAKKPEEMALIRDSSYFHQIDPDTVGIGVDLPPDGLHFGGAFGTPFDPARFNAANVFTLLSAAVATDLPLPAVFLTVGDDDSHGLWRGAIALFETMRADGRPIAFRVTDGDHSWDVWRTSIVPALAFIDSHWGAAPVAGEKS